MTILLGDFRSKMFIHSGGGIMRKPHQSVDLPFTTSYQQQHRRVAKFVAYYFYLIVTS